MQKFVSLLLFLPLSNLYAFNPKATQAALSHQLKMDLALHFREPKAQFDELLNQWDGQYGERAIAPLLSIAKDHKNQDTYRYVAILGLARLGGEKSKVHITQFSKDKIWMMRMASLEGLKTLVLTDQIKITDLEPTLSNLLKDQALVVRNEAMIVARALKTSNLAAQIAETLNNAANFHHGKPLWVPEKALFALQEFNLSADRQKEISLKLVPALKKQKDPAFLSLLVETIEKLRGETLARGSPIQVRAKAWREHLKIQ